MDKNTIWAIVLSTLVIVGFFFLQPLIFGNKNSSAATEQSQLVTSEDSAQTQVVTDSLFTQEETQFYGASLQIV